MTDEYAIELAKTEFREGFNTADAERVLACFSAEGFANFSDGQPSFWGEDARQALRLQLAETFATLRVELSVIIAEVIVTGDSALCWGWHKFVLSPQAGGEPVQHKERYLEIWKKRDDSWKIEYYMTNRESPPHLVEEMAGRAALNTGH